MSGLDHWGADSETFSQMWIDASMKKARQFVVELAPMHRLDVDPLVVNEFMAQVSLLRFGSLNRASEDASTADRHVLYCPMTDILKTRQKRRE